MIQSERPVPLLVLGLGNLLCGDDGLGVVAVERLRRDYVIPDDVQVLDGGTLGLALLPHLLDAECAILVDAIAADGPPGTLVRLQGDDVAHAVAHRLSVHQVGVADLLDAARLIGRVPPRLVLVGLVPGPLDLSVERSAAVAEQLPRLVASVAAETRRLGFPLTLRRDDDPHRATEHGPASPGRRLFGV